MTETLSTQAPVRSEARRWAAVVICWLLIVMDGYDLIVYGAVQNSLIEGTDWGLTPSSAGTLGSLAFLGMMIGAVVAGRLSDSLGRRRTILACAIVFAIATVACALAPNPATFGALRLIAGLGLGGLVPSANALTAELIPPRWRGSMATLMMSGVPLGGTIAALTGIWLIPALGWRSMFWVTAISFVVIVIAFKVLPETSTTRDSTMPSQEKAGFRTILGVPWLSFSILFALTTLFTLFAWYGLGTQLPKIMRDSGADLGPALAFTLALNLGAVVGSVLTAWAGDRFGILPTATVSAAVAGIGLVSLMGGTTATVAIYVALVLAGIGTHGTQSLIIGAIASHYPEHLRGTALGWALGVGRIGAVLAPQVSGILLGLNGVPPAMNFLLFGGAALLSALVLGTLTVLTRKRRTQFAEV
ncbi:MULTISPECIES: MFS transporter [Brevibacterium]|uniref:Aromatic acid/H+ symport family MFS transporter n=2 Tax=Brevibacterium TaxID=1696 RepID=A0ABP9TZ87_9MICO